MSARIPPGFAEAWMRFNTPGDAENMYISQGVELAAGAAASVGTADAILASMNSCFDGLISSAYSLGPGHVIFGNDGGDIRVDGTASPENGTQAATAYPPNVAILVRKNTNAGGRRGRGRLYFPGAPESSAGSDGQLDSTYRSTCQTALNALLVELEDGAPTDAAVVFHDTAPFTPTTITSYEVQQYVATQRRRLRP